MKWFKPSPSFKILVLVDALLCYKKIQKVDQGEATLDYGLQ